MNRKSKILIILASSLAVLLVLTVLVPSWRDRARSAFVQKENEILASAEGDLLNDGSSIKVLKVRSGETLYVEVLRMLENGDSSVVERINLPDKHDGLFNYQGHVTRLAIGDIDNDGKVELIAPSFDNQLVPHLNVYQYNAATRRFELYQPGTR